MAPLHRRVTSSPLLWGGAASIGVYRLLRLPELQSDAVDRYLDGHPISRLMVFLFCVGAASLLGRYLALRRERTQCGAVDLPESATDAPAVLEALEEAPASARQSLLGRRLEQAAKFLVRHPDARGLEDELRNLADEDAARGQAAYALPRIVIWATPILGFLGTVIGITIAIAKLSPQALEESLSAVTAGLAVAFDTTALALGFSMVLMFAQFFVERLQRRVLEEVETGASDALLPRLARPAEPAEDNAEQLKTVLSSLESLVRGQAEEWTKAVGTERDQWRRTAEATVESARNTLLKQAEELHAARWEQFAARHERLLTTQEQGWNDLQAAFVRHSDRLLEHGQGLEKHSEAMVGAMRAVDEIGSLEAALNRNLKALAGAKNFEETVLLLSSSIRLLNARLGGPDARGAEKAA